mgnify:CR=1 FL=1
MSTERSKRTGRFIAGRKHRKKSLTKAAESSLYYSMAEKYLVMAYKAAPQSWTRRRADMLDVMREVVSTKMHWDYSNVEGGYTFFMYKAVERRLERLGIQDWRREKQDTMDYKRKRRQ